MSEEQRKPLKRWYRKWLNIVLLLFLICAIALIIALSVGRHYGPDYDKGICGNDNAWCNTQYTIQQALIAYASEYNGSVSTLTGNYTNTNCSNCRVVNMSALLVQNGGLLRVAPSGLNLSASGNDNCGGNASLGCRNGSSYIWIVDTYGTVYSYCAGANCKTNNSGYQGVWP